MSYEFRQAKRENVSLILGVAGPSGGGKTYSALRLAKGMSEGRRFAFIDTEAGRALHYADQFEFDHLDLRPPFKPSVFEDAIKAASAYPVVIVDNFSHEYAGEGGILDWQEAELTASVLRATNSGDKRSEWQLRDSYKMSSWIKPKTEHKRMVQRLLQNRSHLILALRAEDKIDMVKNAQGKTEIVPKQTLSGFKGWIPICEKNLLFELTASFILTPDKPGIPQPIKLQEQHRKIIDLTKPLDEESGARLAAWAKGGANEPRPAPAGEQPSQVGHPGRAEAPETRDQGTDDGPQDAGEGAGSAPAPPASSKTRGALIAEVFELLNKTNAGSQKRSAATLRALSLDFALPNETSNLSDFPDSALAKIALMTPEKIKEFQRAAGIV